jgi:hypothetical protein
MVAMKSFLKQTVIAITIVTAFSDPYPALADPTSSLPDTNSTIILEAARIINQIYLLFS